MSRQTRAYRKGVKVSERHGAGEWAAERWSSVLLAPLSIWGFWGAWTVSGAGYAGAVGWLAQGANAWAVGALLVLALWHMNMGLKVIVDDYIHRPASRSALLGLSALACLVLAAAGVFFIARLALGSAPLPAGFGI